MIDDDERAEELTGQGQAAEMRYRHLDYEVEETEEEKEEMRTKKQPSQSHLTRDI